MPFLSQDDEELKKQQGPQAISGQSTVLNAPQAAQKPGAPASSGQFKNLQTYLDANKEQAQQMGQQVVGSAEQSAQEAQQKQSQFQAAKPQDVQQQSAESLAQSYYENPNAKKEDYAALKSTGGYTGPKSYNEMADYQAAQAATKKASEQVGQLQSQTGFEQAVAQQYERPQYSQGAKRLDASLIRGEEQSKKAAEQAYQKWGNLQNLLDQSINPVQSQIEKNKQIAQANRELISGPQGAEQQYIENLYNPIAQRAEQLRTENQQRINNLQQDITDLELSPETLAAMGLKHGDVLYGTSLQNYLNINPDATTLTPGGVATEEERTKWSNLMNLIGGADDRIKPGTQQNLNPYEFRSSEFQQARAENQRKYEDVAVNTPAANNLTIDVGSSGLGIPSNLQNAMNTMNLEELANAITKGTIPTGYGGSFNPNSGFGKQIMDQYNIIRNTFGANQRITNPEMNAIQTSTGFLTGGIKR